MRSIIIAGFAGGIIGMSMLTTPASAEGPLRLSEAHLDAVTAGQITADGTAFAEATGEKLAKADTKVKSNVNANKQVKSGVVISQATARACCDPSSDSTSADTTADVSGDIKVNRNKKIEVSGPKMSMTKSISVAVGVTPPDRPKKSGR